jgi:hypothetical protein
VLSYRAKVAILLVSVILIGSMYNAIRQRKVEPDVSTVATTPEIVTTPTNVPRIPTESEYLAARQQYIKEVEDHLLDQGMDVYLSLSGKNRDELTVKYVLMSRPTVHQLSKDSDFTTRLYNLGFSRVTFTDGYNETWTMKLR